MPVVLFVQFSQIIVESHFIAIRSVDWIQGHVFLYIPQGCLISVIHIWILGRLLSGLCPSHEGVALRRFSICRKLLRLRPCNRHRCDIHLEIIRQERDGIRFFPPVCLITAFVHRVLRDCHGLLDSVNFGSAPAKELMLPLRWRFQYNLTTLIRVGRWILILASSVKIIADRVSVQFPHCRHADIVPRRGLWDFSAPTEEGVPIFGRLLRDFDRLTVLVGITKVLTVYHKGNFVAVHLPLCCVGKVFIRHRICHFLSPSEERISCPAWNRSSHFASIIAFSHNI